MLIWRILLSSLHLLIELILTCLLFTIARYLGGSSWATLTLSFVQLTSVNSSSLCWKKRALRQGLLGRLVWGVFKLLFLLELLQQVVGLTHRLFVLLIIVTMGTVASTPRFVFRIWAGVRAGSLLFPLRAQAFLGHLELWRSVLRVCNFIFNSVRTWFWLWLWWAHCHG